MRCRTVVALMVVWVAASVRAGDPAEGPVSKVSGHTYFDYYDRVQATEANEKGLNGFEMRRLYLTYDYAVKQRYKVRVRMEANDGALALQPKAVSGARLDKDKLAGLDAGASMFTVLVKDAYVQWNPAVDALESLHPAVVFGVQSTPAYGGIEEDAWKYRSLEKTILDLNGVVSSRDMGIAVKGTVGPKGRCGYWLLVANDTTKAETNKHKHFYGLATYEGEHVLAELYADLRQKPNDRNATTTKALIGYRADAAALHGVLFQRWSKNARKDDPTTQVTSGISVFGRYGLSDAWEAVGRVDVFDPDSEEQDDGYSLLILGIAYSAHKDLDLIPNVWVRKPQNTDADPDIVPRLTVYYRF